jgi:hypothetical protein
MTLALGSRPTPPRGELLIRSESIVCVPRRYVCCDLTPTFKGSPGQKASGHVMP